VPGLSIVSPPFAAALIFLALGGWALWRRLRRTRRGRQVTAATGVGAVVLTIAAALTLANSYFSYLPQVRDVTNVVSEERNWPDYAVVAALPVAAAHRKWPNGVVVHLDVPDRGSGFGNSTALVWLPPQYFTHPAERFPVVYLFHGSPGVPGDWFRGGQAAQSAGMLADRGHPVIIVSPRMSHGWLDDPECVNGIHEKVESHLLDDVFPAVDGTLRTIADRTGRTLGGMSAGGYCALNLGLRHRDLVSSIIDMSGFTAPTHTGGMAVLFGPPAPAQVATVRANSPGSYAATLPPGPPMRIWMDAGNEDKEVLEEMTPVAAELKADGLQVDFRVRPGAHTFYVWAPALRQALPWTQGLPAGTETFDASVPGPAAVPVAHVTSR
jgi:enterochelin esterase-like enzyme